eukprot:INCI14092.2.p1 GENE.INCI14092.2~~INCI14092.2.p1  ORF type:complete len:402 (+),score=52.45 INCI14092.2:83-1288(+)
MLRVCSRLSRKRVLASPFSLKWRAVTARHVSGGSSRQVANDKLRVLFFGTDEVSLPTLRKIHEVARQGVVDSKGRSVALEDILVVTPPDVRKGRKRILQPVPIKQYCLDNGIAVIHPPPTARAGGAENGDAPWIPDNAGDFDVGVVVSFGYMIPEDVLRRLPFGAINLHPSLLPRYRGAAPVQRCLLNGDDVTGVSIIRVTANKFDSGDIIEQKKFSLDTKDAETSRDGRPLATMVASELLETLAESGAEDVLEVLLNLEDALSQAKPQGSRKELPRSVRTARKVVPSMGLIDWQNCSQHEIMCQFRALNNKPGTFTFLAPINANDTSDTAQNKKKSKRPVRVNVLGLRQCTFNDIGTDAVNGRQPGAKQLLATINRFAITCHYNNKAAVDSLTLVDCVCT